MELVMNYRNSVGVRLMLGFAGVIMVFGAAITLSISRLATFNAALNDITGHQFAKVETSNAWALTDSESMRHTRNMLILDDKAKSGEESAATRELIQKRKQLADLMSTLVQSATGKAMLKT